ncbi:MAG: glycosyltransferase [Eubacteriales bacterium]|nr:glycosyltransferase [Eubacteriales bacterium]
MTLNIIFPVLNEQLRLRAGIEKTIRYMEHYCEKYGRIAYQCTIADNGSDDGTPQIARELERRHPDVVRYLRIEERGVGIAFRTGVEQNTCDIVGTMDIDLSTDIVNLGRTIQLFMKNPELQYVNATRFHKKSKTEGRRWYRKITSAGLVFLLRANFHMKASDAICGFTFLRSETARSLVAECSDDTGWFYMIELLLRAERRGVKIYDMPVRFTEDYNTTVNVPKTIRNYLSRIRALKRAFRQEEKEAKTLQEEEEIYRREV